MANVTVTRADGSTETIVLTDKKEDGHEYMGFQCSDGVTRYVLLGESTDSKASHLWIEKGGVKKYCLKDPTTALTFDVKTIESTFSPISSSLATIQWEYIEVGNLFKFAPINFVDISSNKYMLYVEKLSGLSSEVQSVTLDLTIKRVIFPDEPDEPLDDEVPIGPITAPFVSGKNFGFYNISSPIAESLWIADSTYIKGTAIQGTYTYTLS